MRQGAQSPARRLEFWKRGAQRTARALTFSITKIELKTHEIENHKNENALL